MREAEGSWEKGKEGGGADELCCQAKQQTRKRENSVKCINQLFFLDLFGDISFYSAITYSETMVRLIKKKIVLTLERDWPRRPAFGVYRLDHIHKYSK